MNGKNNNGQKGWLSRTWNRFKEWWLANLWWEVGLLVFIVGVLVWTSLLLIGMPLKAYWPGLVLIGLSGPATGFTYWRGQQTRAQIEKAQRQIDATHQQTRYQSFNDAVQMAVDVESPTRAVAGWKRLERWVDNESDDSENLREIASSTALGVLTLKSKTKAAFGDDLERYEQAEDTPSSWEDVRRNYFEESDKTRINKDVRQQALEFLMKHPLPEWAELLALKRWEVSDCDLSDLTLSAEALKRRGPAGEWEFTAENSHCMGMRTEGGAVDLPKFIFVGAKMMGADLTEVNLSEALFYDADLRYADLAGVNLSGASLGNADLRYADLSNANLQNSFLKSVRFYRTSIDRADFTGVRGLPVNELKALLQGCWWSRLILRIRGGVLTDCPDGKELLMGCPTLPDGIDPEDIPGSADKTVPTGGRVREPPQG